MPNKIVDRNGLTNINKQGELMTIINYIDFHHVVIEFKQTKTQRVVSFSHFQNGNVVDKFYPIFYNIGYLGNTISCINGKEKLSYTKWCNMLQRCYTDLYPNYQHCVVCDEWLCYTNFEQWFNDNYSIWGNGKMSLDKDLLYKHNKIYSPQTCLIVDSRINTLILDSRKIRGDTPIGVYRYEYNGNIKYEVSIKKKNKKYHFGSYDTPEEAFMIYKKEKEKYIKQVADEYKTLYSNFPQKVYDALYNYSYDIDD